MNTTVEIKASTLKDLYYKLLGYEPVLDRLSIYSKKCVIRKEHKRRSSKPIEYLFDYKGWFTPSKIMSEHDIKIAFHEQ